MKKFLVFLTALMFLFTFTSPTLAGWWIFGQGTDEITTNYIYINQNSFDESGQEMTLFKETIKDGTARINGRASVRNAKIGAVYVSLDNKETWQKAKLSDNGYFEYIFTPKIGKTYHVYIKIIDTLGKTNDIESTYKKVTVSNENIYDKVIESLNNLVQAYQNQDPGAFMKYVSDNFAGDYAILDFAIRKDFNAFDYIELRPFVNNISRDGSGRVFVAIQYIRKVVATKSGQVYTDNGFTEFVFSNDNGVFKVFSMKNPLLFGLSDAGEVATGTIQNINNNPIVLVDQYGNVDAKNFRTAIETIENDSAFGTSTVSTGTINLQDSAGSSTQGYKFETESYISAGSKTSSDFYLEINQVWPGNGIQLKDMGSCSLNSINEAPTSGYSSFIAIATTVGNCFAVKMSNDKYAVVEIKSWVDTNPVFTGSFDYKYWE